MIEKFIGIEELSEKLSYPAEKILELARPARSRTIGIGGSVFVLVEAVRRDLPPLEESSHRRQPKRISDDACERHHRNPTATNARNRPRFRPCRYPKKPLAPKKKRGK